VPIDYILHELACFQERFRLTTKQPNCTLSALETVDYRRPRVWHRSWANHVLYVRTNAH
jgi:hypothetical protein